MTNFEAQLLVEERQTSPLRTLVGCVGCGYEWWVDHSFDAQKDVAICVCCGSFDIVEKNPNIRLRASAA